MGLWCALLLACTGAIGGESGAVGPEASPGKPGSEDNAPLPATNPPPSASVGQVPLRRLSRVEYRKTLADLLRVPVEEKDIAATESYGPSGYPEGGAFSPDEVDRMLAAVDTLAARYAATQLTADMPCKPQSDADRACAQAFVKAFGARAYRHPISRQETLDLMGVYDEGRKDRSLKEALSLVVRAALLEHRKHKSGTLSITIPSGPGFCRAQVGMSPFLASRDVPFWVCGMVAPLGRRVRSRPNSGPPMVRRPEEPLPPS